MYELMLGNMTHTSRALKVAIRTLRYMLRSYGVPPIKRVKQACQTRIRFAIKNKENPISPGKPVKYKVIKCKYCFVKIEVSHGSTFKFCSKDCQQDLKVLKKKLKIRKEGNE